MAEGLAQDLQDQLKVSDSEVKCKYYGLNVPRGARGSVYDVDNVTHFLKLSLIFKNFSI